MPIIEDFDDLQQVKLHWERLEDIGEGPFATLLEAYAASMAISLKRLADNLQFVEQIWNSARLSEEPQLCRMCNGTGIWEYSRSVKTSCPCRARK